MSGMYKELGPKGLEILAFPCNQFMGQEPGTADDIAKFVCSLKYDVDFPVFSRDDVYGKNQRKEFKFLNAAFPGDITWNFMGKFLVDRNGVPVRRFAKESWEEIKAAIEEELAKGEEETDKSDKSEDKKASASAL